MALLALATTAACTSPAPTETAAGSRPATFEAVDCDGEDAPEAHRAFLAVLEP